MRFSRRATRRLILVGATLVLAVTAISAWRVVRRLQVHRLATEARAEGMMAYDGGDYEAALPKLSYYLSRHKDDVVVLRAFAEARSKVPKPNGRHLTEATALYGAALGLDADNLEALAHLLDLQRRLGRRVESLGIADRILALDPNHVEALAVKASGLFLEERLEEALSYAQRLIDVRPDNTRWHAEVLRIRRAQNATDEELIRLSDSWIDGYEADGRFRLLKSQVLLSLGRVDAARREARTAAGQGAASLEVLQDMIAVLDGLALRDQADEVIAEARARFPQEQWVVASATRRFWQVGRFEEAMAELNGAEPTFGVLDVELQRLEALLLIQAGRDDEAQRTLARILELADDGPPDQRAADRAWAEAIQARVNFEAADWLETVQVYDRAIALQPDDAVLHFLLADAYASVGERELAAASLRRAIELDPHWLAPQLSFAESLMSLGLAREALQTMVRLLRRTPNAGPEPYVLLAQAWLASDASVRDVGVVNTETGRPGDLVELLTTLYERSARKGTVAGLLARAHLARGRPQAAVELIERTLLEQAPDPQVLLSLARVSEQSGLGLEQELIDRAREVAGLTLDVAEAEARRLRDQGRVEEGLALINEAWASSPDPRSLEPRARRLRIAYLAGVDDPGARLALSELLDAEPESVEAADFVLSQSSAWQDRELITEAIERLAAMTGERSPRVMLARARSLLLFESTDAAKLAEATILVGDVLGQTPSSLPALTLMSRLLLAGTDPNLDEAVNHLKWAVDLYPGRADLYPRLITLLQEQGDLETAERYLERLSKYADRDPQLRRAEVQLLYDQGDFEMAALRLSEHVGATSPESDQLLLASLHQRVGDHEEAERIYRRVLAAADRSDKAVRAAADFYANQGRLDEAVRLIGGFDDPAAEALALGALYQKHGDLDEAGQWFREAVRLAPDEADAWSELAKHYVLVADYEQAHQAALAGLRIDNENTALQATLAASALRVGDAARRETLDLLEDVGGNNQALLDTIGLFDRVATGDGGMTPTKSDFADAEQLVRAHPRYLPAWRLAVTINTEAGRIEEAAELARRATGRLPSEAGPAEWATRLFVQAGRLEEALDMARIWQRRSQERPIAADTIVASLQLDLGRPRAAVAQLGPHADRIWVERDRFPQRVMVWLRALLLDRQLDRVTPLIEPLFGQGQQWRGVWLQLARTAPADIAYEALVLIEPFLLESPGGTLALAREWTHLAQRTGDEGYFDRAEGFAMEAGRDEQQEVASRHLHASIALSRHDFESAESLYRGLVAEGPNGVVALNNLAVVLIRRGDGCDEAVTLVARAIDLAPNNAELLDTRAQALLCAGHPDEAERSCRLALAQRSDDPGLLVTLIKVMIAQSRFDEAESELTRAEMMLEARPQSDETSAKLAALREQLRRP